MEIRCEGSGQAVMSAVYPNADDNGFVTRCPVCGRNTQVTVTAVGSVVVPHNRKRTIRDGI